MMEPDDEVWEVSPGNSDDGSELELDRNVGPYAKLGKDSPKSILRTNKEAIESKQFSLMLIKRLPDSENYDNLQSNLDESLNYLKYDTRLIENELESRDLAKEAYTEKYEFPIKCVDWSPFESY